APPMCGWDRRFSGIGDSSLSVIASEAKQSSLALAKKSWIASSLQRKIASQFCRELLAMTARDLTKPHRHFSQHTKIHRAEISGVDGKRRVTRPCRHHPPRLQRHAELTQFVGKPGQRGAGVAEHVLAVADELLAAHRGHRPLLDQIH